MAGSWPLSGLIISKGVKRKVYLYHEGNHKENWLGTFLDQFWMNKEKFTGAGFEPATSGLTCRRSTNWANLPYIGGLPYFVNIFVRGARVRSHETIYCPLARDHAQVTIQLEKFILLTWGILWILQAGRTTRVSHLELLNRGLVTVTLEWACFLNALSCGKDRT